MSNVKHTLTSILFATAAVFCGIEAKAADTEILVKISDVKLTKDLNGATTGCDFNATFYNRSAFNVNNAGLELIWTDDAAENIINQEKAEAELISNAGESTTARRANANRSRTSLRSSTEEATPGQVSLTVELPPLNSYQQLTLPLKLKNDRCFLLVNDKMDINVNDCSLSGTTAATADNRGQQTEDKKSCTRIFKYVSSRDSQYYREFKPISLEEQKKIETDANEKNKNDIAVSYQNALDGMNKAIQTLSEIK